MTKKRTPGKTPEERVKYWTRVIKAARLDPKGVRHYCDANDVSLDNYYSWFRKLRPLHPDWTTLSPPHSRKKNELMAPTQVEPDTQVSEKATRRKFAREYKLRILKEADAASDGQVSAILRREGLYYSHLQNWRAERDQGSLEPKKRGRKANPLTAENRRLKAENERLLRKLEHQAVLLDLQKKVSEILNVKLPTMDDN